MGMRYRYLRLLGMVEVNLDPPLAFGPDLQRAYFDGCALRLADGQLYQVQCLDAQWTNFLNDIIDAMDRVGRQDLAVQNREELDRFQSWYRGVGGMGGMQA